MIVSLKIRLKIHTEYRKSKNCCDQEKSGKNQNVCEAKKKFKPNTGCHENHRKNQNIHRKSRMFTVVAEAYPCAS
jgi:hypothetical protein